MPPQSSPPSRRLAAIHLASDPSSACGSPVSVSTTHFLDGAGAGRDDTARRTPRTDGSAPPGTDSRIHVWPGGRHRRASAARAPERPPPPSAPDGANDDDAVRTACEYSNAILPPRECPHIAYGLSVPIRPRGASVPKTSCTQLRKSCGRSKEDDGDDEEEEEDLP